MLGARGNCKRVPGRLWVSRGPAGSRVQVSTVPGRSCCFSFAVPTPEVLWAVVSSQEPHHGQGKLGETVQIACLCPYLQAWICGGQRLSELLQEGPSLLISRTKATSIL